MHGSEESLDTAGLEQCAKCDHVILIASDGSKINLPIQFAKMSQLLNTAIVDGGIDYDNEIPIPNVKSEVLHKICDYLTYRGVHPPPVIEKPLKSSFLAECFDEWDLQYTNMSIDMLYDIISAANFMGIIPLLELTCARFAYIYKYNKELLAGGN